MIYSEMSRLLINFKVQSLKKPQMKIFNEGLRSYLHKLLNWRIKVRIVFFLFGMVSTMWFLIRVIPKPSRAGYPCMRAAAPLMSAFIIYLISITASVFALKKFKRNIVNARYLAAAGFIIIAAVSLYFSGLINNFSVKAAHLVDPSFFISNDPIGIARGINPGRVVWVWNQDATDINCTNKSGDYWYQNTDASEVDSMLVHGLMDMTGEPTALSAWNAIFRYFNSNHGRGDIGYTSGEKIYIKINLTNSCCSVSGTTKTSGFEQMDATPELSLAMLRQLIDVVGIAQTDVYLGDPYRTFHNLYWDVCHSIFPNVNYCDAQGMNGRHKTVATDTNVIKFSNGVNDVRIPKEYMDATYFINMPCLKTHNEGGITLTAKNHQGSIIEQGTTVENQSAQIMHPSLPANNPGYGKYRHLVDYMGHNKLGGNTLLFIVDGIWAGRNWESIVEKWQMGPFIGDYPSSLFLSQDEVAIQSVCFDFLLEEYKNKPTDQKYPYLDGVDDFLYQAADPAYWPAGVEYDPEGDGSNIGSLGVYEHWNNATDKQYSRNLAIGDGIELVTDTMGSMQLPNAIKTYTEKNKMSVWIYPNPASDQIFFEYSLNSPGKVLVEIYSINGDKISELRNTDEYTGSHQLCWRVDNLPAGIYLFNMQVSTYTGSSFVTEKFSAK